MKALCSSETLETTQQNTLHLKKGSITFLRNVGSQRPYLLTYGAEPFLRSRQLCSHSRTSSIYGIRRFITVFTTALHWSLSWARVIQSTPSHPISLRSILILSTHLRLGLPSGLLPSGFPSNILFAFLFSPTRSQTTTCIFLVGFQVLTAVIMKSSIVWDIMSCSPLKANRSFRGICYLIFRVEDEALSAQFASCFHMFLWNVSWGSRDYRTRCPTRQNCSLYFACRLFHDEGYAVS
jgi:hypothetical protein